MYGANKARNFIKKIRGSVQYLPQPTIATPTEIQARFHDILSEAVKLATLFNKSDHQTDVLMFGHKLKCLSCVNRDSKMVSSDADREFCKDLLDWFCKNILLILVFIFLYLYQFDIFYSVFLYFLLSLILFSLLRFKTTQVGAFS